MCDNCGADTLLEQIDEELALHDFGKVQGFLEDVRDFAQRTGHVTDKQRSGVLNCFRARRNREKRR